MDQACSTASLALDLATNVDSPRIVGHVREFHSHLAAHAQEAPVIAFEAKTREEFSWRERPTISRGGNGLYSAHV